VSTALWRGWNDGGRKEGRDRGFPDPEHTSESIKAVRNQRVKRNKGVLQENFSISGGSLEGYMLRREVRGTSGETTKIGVGWGSVEACHRGLCV